MLIYIFKIEKLLCDGKWFQYIFLYRITGVLLQLLRFTRMPVPQRYNIVLKLRAVLMYRKIININHRKDVYVFMAI